MATEQREHGGRARVPAGAPRLRACRVVTTSLTARLLLAHQLEALSDEDWTVVSGDPFEDAPAGLNVKVIPIRREFSVADVPAFFQLLSYFRRQRFDVAQTHTPKASFLGLPALRLSGTPAIYTVHGSLFFRDNTVMANVAGWIFERWCCAWADDVLVQSREDEGALSRSRICPARKVTYLGNGIELERFTASVEPAFSADKPVVLMVSRLVREKGCLDFFAIAKALKGRASFVHVGPFEHDQSDAVSEAEVEEVKRSGTVSFVGSVSDVRPYLAAADVVVLPSFREGIPRAAMEAAAAGLPVAAYDIRGVREVIPPETGLLAPRGNVAALTAVVEALVLDGERREQLGRACRERVVTSFSEDDVIARLRGIYRTMAARRPRTGGAPRAVLRFGRTFGGNSPSQSAGVYNQVPAVNGHAGDASRRRVCLTIDVEDWYDGMAVLGREIARPDVAMSGLSTLLHLLDTHCPKARVTLFVVGNYLDRVSGELAELVSRGHEVASHGPDHGRFPDEPSEVAAWLRRGKDALEDRLQVPVLGFRSPRFDVPGGMALAAFRDVLAEAGFEYVSDNHELGLGSPLAELPVLTLGPLPIGGGSYQRALPTAAVGGAVRRHPAPTVLYYHSYDFGATLPNVSSSRSMIEAEQLIGRQRIAKIFTNLLFHFGSEACRDVAS